MPQFSFEALYFGYSFFLSIYAVASFPGFKVPISTRFYPGKPGLGLKQFWTSGYLVGLQYFDVQICVFYGNLTDKTSFFFKNISIRIYKKVFLPGYA